MQYPFLRELQKRAGDLQTGKFHFHIGQPTKKAKKETKNKKKTLTHRVYGIHRYGIHRVKKKMSKASPEGNCTFCIYYNFERVSEHVSRSELIATLKKT